MPAQTLIGQAITKELLIHLQVFPFGLRIGHKELLENFLSDFDMIVQALRVKLLIDDAASLGSEDLTLLTPVRG